MSTPMYDNVSLHSSTHVYLCTISEKKSSWYVKKGLGERRGNVLTLNFEPDFMGDKLPGKPSDIEYHRRYKRNECVVCGSTSSGFMRHYVVPSCFRCLFPKRFKSHLSHDVVLVCSRCHVGVQAETGRRMTKVIWVVEGRRGNGVGMWVVDRGVMEARNAAVAIRKYRGKMPKDVVERHEEIIRGYLGRDFGEGDLEVMEKVWGGMERSDSSIPSTTTTNNTSSHLAL